MYLYTDLMLCVCACVFPYFPYSDDVYACLCLSKAVCLSKHPYIRSLYCVFVCLCLPLQVTIFIYTDLMLLTREDEPGRCNVLQSPLYLHQLKLQDGQCTYER